MKLYKDQYIVITGAAGFIGSCVVRYLNDQGFYNLIAVDELGTSEQWKNLVGKKFCDYLEKDQLFTWLEGREREIEAFIHLGACSDTVERDASYLVKNNYHYSVRLAEYALKNEHRLIYASSAATYGDGSEGFSDQHQELDRLRPLNMYGFSKHLFDLWLKNQNLLDRVVGLKFFNVFGPNEYHKGRMASAVGRMLRSAQESGVVELFKSDEHERFADGEQVRDFIYVKDAVRMTCAFLENDACGIFNIGTGVPSTWNDLAHAVFKAIDRPPKIKYIDFPSDLAGRYQNYTCAQMSKAKEALGQSLVQCSPLDESIAEYVNEYLLMERRW